LVDINFLILPNNQGWLTEGNGDSGKNKRRGGPQLSSEQFAQMSPEEQQRILRNLQQQKESASVE
jgi:hypothetical protein